MLKAEEMVRINLHLLTATFLLFLGIFGQIFDQIFGQIFGQVFDQVFG